MDAIARTVWIIEASVNRDTNLDEIASAAGLSRYHLTRVFGQIFGRSVMSYLRARRLSVAAKRLANGATDILSLALDSGYGSHEAFTRAFRQEFGVTPDEYRSSPNQAKISVTEPITMNANSNIKLNEPRMLDAKEMRFAGLGKHFDYGALDNIPGLWQQFGPHIGSIPGEVAGATYGVCANSDDDGLDYIAAVEVTREGDLPDGFKSIEIPSQRYAVFAHKGHLSEIRNVIRAVFGGWLPGSSHELATGPTLERYGEGFDPATGRGGFEIWVPVKS